MSEESSSGNDKALVNSVLKKCFTDNQLHPSTSKKPRRSDTLSNDLITDEDLPRIATELQVLVDEARAIGKDQNKVKVNEMITKWNEDLFWDLLTPRILLEKQLLRVMELVKCGITDWGEIFESISNFRSALYDELRVSVIKLIEKVQKLNFVQLLQERFLLQDKEEVLSILLMNL
ncbi:hypothetical protein L2E82_05041 [Cichorium intybus]|uniref:Uncharacterized protein n=1 Tax=Cichorium intybus TaxID=13427 RepID=A0ACB9H7K1_CICIN|nr:hypothetical protein L2E82_05041 [Cichorium intybus]